MSVEDERFEAGLRVRRDMGWEGELPSGMDEDFFRHTTAELFGHVFTRPGLTLREREMITLAVIIAVGGGFENLYTHFKAARHLDITDEQIKEIIIQTMYYAGWPKGANATKIYNRIKAGERPE